MENNVIMNYVKGFEDNRSLATRASYCILKSPKCWSIVSWDLEHSRYILNNNINTTDEEVLEYIKDVIRTTDIKEFKKVRGIGKKTFEVIERIKNSLSVENEMGAYI